MSLVNIEHGWLARILGPEVDIAVWLREHTGGTPRIAFEPNEAAHCLGISRSRLYQEIGSGRLQARKSGRATIITVGDLLAWLHAPGI
jgi:excisionase family DNA binding protein